MNDTRSNDSRVSINLTQLALVIAIVGTGAALFGAYVTMPYRMEQVEYRVSKLEETQKSISVMVGRIDENVKRLLRDE